MRHQTMRLVPLLLSASLCACSSTADEASDMSAGWRSLFDGQTTAGWRGYQKEGMPAGWQVQDGALVRAEAAGDIITVETFDNFILSLEWRISVDGNSGIFYRATEEGGAVYFSAPEYQVLDNAVLGEDGDLRTSAGSNYALHAPPEDYTRAPGEWNHAMIEVRGAHVRHWLNGHLVVDYELWSPRWEELVAASKFAAWPGYGRALGGHIGLQDHGNEVAYRSIRVLTLE